MAFNFKNRERSGSGNLTEEDIRNRLYGSAVNVITDYQPGQQKRPKKPDDKERVTQKQPDNEQTKVRQEILALKKELEQTKKKLKRMQGVNTKKIRLLFISFILFIAAAVLAAFIIKGILNVRTYKVTVKPAPINSDAAQVASDGVSYSVQVATYGALSLAEKFSSDLKSKGYDTFVNKTQYGSGKDKYIIFAGRLSSKKDASTLLGKIKKIEGAEDSFIVSLPR